MDAFDVTCDGVGVLGGHRAQLRGYRCRSRFGGGISGGWRDGARASAASDARRLFLANLGRRTVRLRLQAGLRAPEVVRDVSAQLGLDLVDRFAGVDGDEAEVVRQTVVLGDDAPLVVLERV